jgi:plastocyanin
MKKNKVLILGSLALLLVLVLTACSGGGGSSSGGSNNVSVTASEFKFDPADVTVTSGQTVNVSLKNTGSVDHTWVVLKQGVNDTTSTQFSADQALVTVKAAAGQTGTGSFTAPAAGQYEIICDVPGHLDSGMKGTLTVK